MGLELRQILGGIMGALAEGRSLSDLVSRNLSTQYERDELLRLFPVPRMEMADAEIEFKFALTEPIRLGSTVEQAKVDAVVQKTAEQGAKIIMENASQLAPGYTGTFDLPRIGNIVHARVVGATLYKSREACKVPPQPGVVLETFSLYECAQGIVADLYTVNLIPRSTTGTEPTIVTVQRLLTEVKETHEKEIMLLRELLASSIEASSFPLDVLMRHRELASLPPEILSSIKMRVNVQNYQWMEVEAPDGTISYRLTTT